MTYENVKTVLAVLGAVMVGLLSIVPVLRIWDLLIHGVTQDKLNREIYTLRCQIADIKEKLEGERDE